MGKIKAKVFGDMDNQILTYSSIEIDFMIFMGHGNYKTVIKSMNIDKLTSDNPCNLNFGL